MQRKGVRPSLKLRQKASGYCDNLSGRSKYRVVFNANDYDLSWPPADLDKLRYGINGLNLPVGGI
jgi:hypothetical protein